MKKAFFIALTAVMFIMQTSCSYHYYYGEGAAPASVKADKIHYDRKGPDYRNPILEKPANNYNADDYKTFAVYAKPYTVAAPTGDSPAQNYAIWCTKKATYLAVPYKMLWARRYFNNQSCDYLRDSRTGKKYPLKRVLGLPVDETYWMTGIPGEWFAQIFEFPPLSPECTEIDIINTDCKPLEYIKGTTGWEGSKDYYNLSVSALQANQHKMKYKETIVVK